MTQTQDYKHHSFDHIFIAYRVSSDYRAQSDVESDDDDVDADAEEYADDTNEDVCQSNNSSADVGSD